MRITTGMGTAITTVSGDDGAGGETFFDLLSWMSPAWPIGSFAFSSGLEWAVEARSVHDRISTQNWIADLLGHGSLWNDAVIFVHTDRAAVAGNAGRLAALVELATALLTGAERRLESTAQGAAYRRIANDVAPCRELAMLSDVADDDLAYPIAAACHLAGHGVDARLALTALLHAAVANLVSAAQRLVPLGQTDGQRALHLLRDDVLATVSRAVALDDTDPFAAIGSAALFADLAGFAHETQYTRLFRT